MFSGKPNPFAEVKSNYDYFYDNVAANKVRNAQMQDYTDAYKVISNQKTSSEDLNGILNNLSKFSASHQTALHKTILSHPNTSPARIDAAVDHPDSSVAIHAISHPNTTPETLMRVLSKSNTGQEPSELFDQAYYKHRIAAASHRNATKEVIAKAMTDRHNHVYQAAKNNPNRTI